LGQEPTDILDLSSSSYHKPTSPTCPRSGSPGSLRLPSPRT